MVAGASWLSHETSQAGQLVSAQLRTPRPVRRLMAAAGCALRTGLAEQPLCQTEMLSWGAATGAYHEPAACLRSDQEAAVSVCLVE